LANGGPSCSAFHASEHRLRGLAVELVFLHRGDPRVELGARLEPLDRRLADLGVGGERQRMRPAIDGAKIEKSSNACGLNFAFTLLQLAA
jgi:hypothetical protein